MLPPWMKKKAPKSSESFIQEYLYIDIYIPKKDDKKISSPDIDDSNRGAVVIDMFSSVDDEE